MLMDTVAAAVRAMPDWTEVLDRDQWREFLESWPERDVPCYRMERDHALNIYEVRLHCAAHRRDGVAERLAPVVSGMRSAPEPYFVMVMASWRGYSYVVWLDPTGTRVVGLYRGKERSVS